MKPKILFFSPLLAPGHLLLGIIFPSPTQAQEQMCSADYSKIGVYTGTLETGETLEFLRAKVQEGKPVPVVVLMDNFGLASQIKSVSPQTIVVGRHYDPNFSGLPGDFSL